MNNKNYLEKNLSCFTDELAESVRNAKPPEWYSPTRGKNNDKSFIVIRNGQTFEAFDGKAPRSFAKKVSRNYDLAKTEATVLIGAGEGHILNQVFRKAENGFSLLLVESDLFLIKEALSNYDFAKYLKEKKLIIATDENEISISLSYFETVSVVEDWYVVINPYTTLLPLTYFDITDFTAKRLNAIRCNTGTMMGAGSQIAYNDLSNLPYLLQYPGVSELKDAYKGKPAVVVSTGPSLAKNVHSLLDEKYRERIVIIAVAQAARILYAYGIGPDYICTVDYGDVNQSHFRGIEECGFPLVALNRTYAPIFETWKGPVYVSTSVTEQRNAVTDSWLGKGTLEQGGSVSHFAFGLAVYLGCSQVALIGQDLAYEGDLSHNPLADSSGSLNVNNGVIDWEITDPRSPLYGTHYDMGPAIPVNGFFGKPVVTNTGLSSFITAFSALAKMHEKKVRLFNATEGGADIPGFRRTTLKSYFDRFAKDVLTRRIETSRYAEGWKADYAKALSVCKLDVANLEELIGYASTGLSSCDKLESFSGNKKRKGNKNFLDALKENERASNEAHKRARKNPLLESAIYRATREIAGKELYVSGKIKDLGKDESVFETRIKRNRLILMTAKTEANKLLEIYETVIEQLSKVIEDPDYLRRKEPERPHLEDVNDYFRKGNWALPYLELRRMSEDECTEYGVVKCNGIRERCEDMHEESLEYGKEFQSEQERREKRIRFDALMKISKEVGVKNKDYRRSYLYLLRANRLFPEDSSVWYGLAASCILLNRHDEALRYYDRLLEEKPGDQRIRFERILALLNSGEIDIGFQELSELLTETTEFDSILFSVAELLYTDPDKREQAISVLEQYLEKFPNNPEAWKRLFEWTGADSAKYKYNRLSRGEKL